MNLFTLDFFVPGRPRAQGSVKAFNVKGRPHPIVKPAGGDLATWRNDVIVKTEREMAAKGVGYPLDGPAMLELKFFFRPPKVFAKQYGSTWAKGGLAAVRKRWPRLTRDDGWLDKYNGDDLDKLCRAVFDGLMGGGAILDDRQICRVNASKLYALHNGMRTRTGCGIVMVVKPGPIP